MRAVAFLYWLESPEGLLARSTESLPARPRRHFGEVFKIRAPASDNKVPVGEVYGHFIRILFA
jgi:hypothetical protein